MSITKFAGETRFDAIVNHFNLDIVEEDEFFNFLRDKGMGVYSDDEELEEAYKEFQER
jgi:hypothetical protein